MELIASLLHKPKVMFLDEPTIGLDILSQRKIREFIKYYNEQTKTTVILTSHYMNDIEALCKRMVLINRGQIMFDGDLSRVNDLFSAKKILRLQLAEEVPAAILSRFGEVKSCEGIQATIEIARDHMKDVAKEILDTLPVVDFTMEDIPVEEGIAMLYQQMSPVEMASGALGNRTGHNGSTGSDGREGSVL